MTHELHFMLNEKKLNRLFQAAKELKIKTISKTIVEIFKYLLPRMEKIQTEFQNRESRYKKIAGDKEKRYHIHVYIPEAMYRQLKQMHEYLNFYSMAQILREIIEIYLRELLNNGIKKTVKKFMGIIRNWEKRKFVWKDKEILRQLSLSSPPALTIAVKYDKNFHPYSLKFL